MKCKGNLIYWAEDDMDDIVIISSCMKELGIDPKINFFGSGQDLLAKLATAERLPDFIVVDLNMPVLNGFETLEQLKENDRYRDVPVMVFSTSEAEEDKYWCHRHGAAAYFVKPPSYRECLIVMQRIWQQYEACKK